MNRGPVEVPLVGGGGEPVDFWRTVNSHGLPSLPPGRVDEERRAFEITLSLPRGRPRTVVLTQGPSSTVAVETTGPEPSRTATVEIAAAVSHILRLDQDLAPFYAGISGDPELAWVAEGAGRMIRSQTVFEDVVKTICTTNCTWAATERMVGALVENLGEPADGPAPAGPRGRAFPTPAAMAECGDGFYTDVARAGYRGRVSPSSRRRCRGRIGRSRGARGSGASRRRRRAPPARAPGSRAVRGGTRDDDGPGADVSPHSRLLDPAHVRPAHRRAGEVRRSDRAAVSPLPPLRGSGVLAVPDPRLGGCRPGSSALCMKSLRSATESAQCGTISCAASM